MSHEECWGWDCSRVIWPCLNNGWTLENIDRISLLRWVADVCIAWMCIVEDWGRLSLPGSGYPALSSSSSYSWGKLLLHMRWLIVLDFFCRLLSVFIESLLVFCAKYRKRPILDAVFFFISLNREPYFVCTCQIANTYQLIWTENWLTNWCNSGYCFIDRCGRCTIFNTS